MTREQKVAKRKARAARRAENHNNKYRDLVRKAIYDNYPTYVPLTIIKTNGWWRDSSSPTGWKHQCEMGGSCQAPCNGDC